LFFVPKFLIITFIFIRKLVTKISIKDKKWNTTIILKDR
jgi:hypothetical protein